MISSFKLQERDCRFGDMQLGCEKTSKNVVVIDFVLPRLVAALRISAK